MLLQSRFSKGQWAKLGFALVLPLLLLVSTGIESIGQSSAPCDVVQSQDSSFVQGQVESDSQIAHVQEQEFVLLSEDLPVDISADGSGFIPAGTLVQSQLLHFDPVNSPTSFVSITCSVTFGHEILGVQTSKGNLDGSDILLGLGGVAHATTDRGLESNDQAALLDNFTVEVNFNVTGQVDQIRVIKKVDGDVGLASPSLDCGPGETRGFIQAGEADDFDSDADLNGASPQSSISAPTGQTLAGFDREAIDQLVVHTFQIPYGIITAARVEAHVRAAGGTLDNDTLGVTLDHAGTAARHNVDTNTPNKGDEAFPQIDLPADIIDALNNGGTVDAYVQDDQNVDYIALTYCYQRGDFAIKKTAVDQPWELGQIVQFEIEVSYTGPDPFNLSSLTLNDLLPDGLRLVGTPSDANWDCPSTDPLECTYLGSSVQAGTLPTITVEGQVLQRGGFNNCAALRLETVDGNVSIINDVGSNDRDCAGFEVASDVGPAPRCGPGERLIDLVAGVNDNFANPANDDDNYGFDNPGVNYNFSVTFGPLPSSISAASVSGAFKSNGDLYANDKIYFGEGGIVIDQTSPPYALNDPSVPANNGYLLVQFQDDHAIDYLVFSFCTSDLEYEPPEWPDFVEPEVLCVECPIIGRQAIGTLEEADIIEGEALTLVEQDQLEDGLGMLGLALEKRFLAQNLATNLLELASGQSEETQGAIGVALERLNSALEVNQGAIQTFRNAAAAFAEGNLESGRSLLSQGVQELQRVKEITIAVAENLQATEWR